ncbi:hypothetical protein R9C00_25560 [Flammeovirgaceae bacterium SG7u.111]|nr:hypothetical protein [Flammeovirgaceae bacterium SG7u.132]WPO35065.1 hypothetical protein R9C00_25560 [Flammeovirgaceae bacterium SG7u.111]
MDEIIYQIDNWSILKLLGGTGVILIGTLVLAKKLLFERIKVSWNKNVKKEIEEIRSELTKNNSTLNALQSNYFLSIQKLYDKRIEAATHIWSATIEVRNKMPSIISLILSILTDNELNNQTLDKANSNGERLGDQIANLNELDVKKMVDPSMVIDQYKPFIRDDLYKIFKIYVAVMGRITLNIILDYKKGSLRGWKKDDGLHQLLPNALTEMEIDYIMGLQIAAFDNLANIFNIKIENLIRKMLSSEDSNIDTIKQLKELENVLNATKLK